MRFSSLPPEIHDQILSQLSPIQRFNIKHLLYNLPYHNLFDEETQQSIVEEGIPMMNIFWNKLDKYHLPSYALRKGSIETLKYLETLGYNFNRLDQLLEAAEYGNESIVMYLHDEGIPWNAAVCAYACKGNQLDLLKRLRKMNVPWNEYCFIFAAKHGHLRIVTWLTENRCVADEYALATAARNGHYDVVTYLYTNCHIMIHTDVVFLSGIASGNTDIVRYLHQNGLTSPNVPIFVSWYGCQPDMLECLLELGYNIGSNEATIAAYYGNNDLVIALYEKDLCQNSDLYFVATIANNEVIKKYISSHNPLVEFLYISPYDKMRRKYGLWAVEKVLSLFVWLRMKIEKIDPESYYGY